MEVKPNNDDLNEGNTYDIFVSKRFLTNFVSSPKTLIMNLNTNLTPQGVPSFRDRLGEIIRHWIQNRVTDQGVLLTVQVWFKLNSTIPLSKKSMEFKWITTCRDSWTTQRRLSEGPLMLLERSSRNSPTRPRTGSSEAASTMGWPLRPDSRMPWQDLTRCSLHNPELRVLTNLRLSLSPLVSRWLKWIPSVTTNLRISNKLTKVLNFWIKKQRNLN